MDLLPKELISTVLCYVVCDDYEDEGSGENNKPVDIAVCNSSGYLLEVFNKNIINSCYILIEDASKIQIYYKFIEDNCKVYYLIKNNNGVMIAVRKYDNTLSVKFFIQNVVKSFKNIKDFKIFDFKNKGYPQIRMQYLDSDKFDIIELTEFDNIKLSEYSYFSLNSKDILARLNSEASITQEENEKMEVDQILQTLGGEGEDQEERKEEQDEQEREEDKSVIKEYLSTKLKGMEKFQNELNYELDNLNLMLNKGLKSECSHLADTSSANTVSSDKVINIKITKTWFRIHNSKWIIGIEFWRFGIRNINDVKVLVRNRDFSSCTYKFFTTSDKISRETARVAQEGANAEHTEIHNTNLKSIAIFALEIPDFGGNSKLSVGFTFIYEKYQYHSETFHLRAEDLFHEKHNFFHDESEMALSEDVLACLMISRNIDLTVEMRYDLGLSLEDVLSKNLGFKKAEVLGRSYYIKKSGHLSGTLISFDRLLDGFIKWKLSISVKDLPRLKIFVKALSNELPLPLRIRILQNTNTECGL